MSIFKLKKSLHNSYPLQSGIRFIHHNPHLFNIGDFLCSPRHYFEFKTDIEDVSIVGGGIFDPSKNLKKKFDCIPEKTVIWGAGFAQNFDSKNRLITDQPYAVWSYRDKIFVDNEHFVPCVSCFHPITSQPIQGSNTLVVLNDDPKVTPLSIRSTIEELCSNNNWKLVWNSYSERIIANYYLTADHIITNSFHAAYWGFLSGRKVSIVAHSQKFLNLANALGLDVSDWIIKYRKGDGEMLLKALSNIDMTKAAILENPDTKREYFQQLNLQFADKIVDNGLATSIRLITR